MRVNHLPGFRLPAVPRQPPGAAKVDELVPSCVMRRWPIRPSLPVLCFRSLPTRPHI